MKDTAAKQRHYLDWAATALPDDSLSAPRAGDFAFGNPSSPHTEGRLAKEALENARSRCADVLGVPPGRLYFTSGGTESNAIALYSLLRRRGAADNPGGKARLLYSAVEHPSVRENCLTLEKLGIASGVIGVEKDGRVSAETLSRALEKNPGARFAAVMAVNNETGAVMDIKALAALARGKKGPPLHFHCDMVQAAGKVPVNIGDWDVDSASFSAHKLGGPRGIGLLYLKKPLETLVAGGEQEGNVRPGTENTWGAAALARVLERRAGSAEAAAELKARERLAYLIRELKKINRAELIPLDRGEDDSRFSPWVLQARFRDVPGEVMVRALDDSGIAVSTGSACSSRSPERPVLAAMALDERTRLEGIRISQGWTTEISDFDALLAGIKKVLAFL